jgi:hypothetical protein
MAKREAQARTIAFGEGNPATLVSAAEEHARALRDQLLESTEQAAQTFVRQTRVEGERTIELAGRRAQAIAETVAAIEGAEKELASKARAFAAAARDLRAELESFAATLARGEDALGEEPAAEPDLRLVQDPPGAGREPETREGGVDRLFSTGKDETPERDSLGGKPDEDTVGEPSAHEDEGGDDDDEDDDPPSPEEIAQWMREREEAELSREARRREEQTGLSLRERLREFFAGPVEAAGEAAEEHPPARHERLYTDLGGAVIGIGGAAALLNFVLLR